MGEWTSDEPERIAAAEELQLTSVRHDGTLRKPVTIWVVAVAGGLYVWSVNGHTAAWFPGTQVRYGGRIWAGVEKDVTLVDADHDIHDQIGAAYRTKYRRYAASTISHIVNREARSTTLKLVPRSI
jgi:hypothetical protein